MSEVVGESCMEDQFNKGEYLRNQFNECWSTIFNSKQDYFSQMTEESFELLKVALGNINNIITYNTTLKFIEKVVDILNLSSEEQILVEKSVTNTKPNDNGFDIEYSGSKKFICEVKCNRPINGSNRFGSAQKAGLNKDIYALLNGKTKSEIASNDMKSYYKFMAIHNFDEKTEEALNHYLLNLNDNIKNRVMLYHQDVELSKDIVYVCLIK